MKHHLVLPLCLVAIACGDDQPSMPDAGSSSADAAPADARPDADPGAVPRVEPETCRFFVPEQLGLTEGTDYACGDLVVHEDRAEGGRTIRVHYLQIEGADTDVATIYLDGGPGGNGNGILFWLAFADPSFLDGFLALGDFLVIAQRGTSLSQPSLLCGNVPGDCATELSALADLADFNTGSNADDVDDLRAGLGYAKLNLYGISYGSRLTLEVLRRHGDNVRAAVAGGTVPAHVVWPAEVPASFHGALQALSASCADDGGCGAAFGDLVTVFQNGVTALNQSPALFDYNGFDVEIYGDTYASILFQLMYSRSSYPMLPLYISDLAERRTDRIADFLRAIFDQFGGGGSDLSDGLYYSVVCGELFNPPDEDAFDQANVATPAVIRDTFSYNWYGLLSTCEAWPRGTPDPGLTEAVTSAVPTLLPNGAIDPITPPRFGEVAAVHLPAAQEIVFANSGHGATLQTGCGNQVLLDFLTDPTQPVDASCAATITMEYTVPAQTLAPLLAPAALRAELAVTRLPPGLREPIERALRKARARD
jgi:pimeloyl-ACP methyl ester carboxylesterase